MERKNLSPYQIITLNDYPIRHEQILKIYFRMFQKGGNKIVLPCPVVHKNLVINNFEDKLKNTFNKFEVINPKAKYFLLDGSHKTTAATLSNKKIPIMIFQSNKDIQSAKKKVEKGELISLTTGESVKKIVKILIRHFKKTKIFQTVEEKTNKMINGKTIPKYMIANFL